MTNKPLQHDIRYFRPEDQATRTTRILGFLEEAHRDGLEYVEGLAHLGQAGMSYPILFRRIEKLAPVTIHQTFRESDPDRIHKLVLEQLSRPVEDVYSSWLKGARTEEAFNEERKRHEALNEEIERMRVPGESMAHTLRRMLLSERVELAEVKQSATYVQLQAARETSSILAAELATAKENLTFTNTEVSRTLTELAEMKAERDILTRNLAVAHDPHG